VSHLKHLLELIAVQSVSQTQAAMVAALQQRLRK
jgi:hypothetical protein